MAGERRHSFEMERQAGSFSREDKLAAMAKSFSTGSLLEPQPEPESEGFAIEFEGDGPLGIGFAQEGGEIVVARITPGTACSEFPELETGLLLREIDGSAVAVREGFHSAMASIRASWMADSAVRLAFCWAQVPAPPRAGARTECGRPSLVGMVHIKDDGVGNLDFMSPIHEAHRKGATPRLGSRLRAPPPPPALSLAGLDAADEPAPRRAETKRERQLQEVQNFLCELKVESFLQAFVDFGVSTLEDLKFIEPTDLPGFGLKPLQQRRVAAALVQLQGGSDASAAPAPAAPGMERSPSQVFETDSFEPPALNLDSDENDGGTNVFISPFLPPAAMEEEAARIRKKAAQQPGVARLHTLRAEAHSAAWEQGFEV